MQTNIVTERLFINDITLDDRVFMLELLNTDGWKRFIGDRNVNNEEEASAYIQKIIDNPKFGYFTVRLKEEGTTIGMVSMIRRDYFEHDDIGFAFLPVYEGKGYAYEAASAVLNHPSTLSAHSRILATALKTNSSSVRLLERLGLTFEQEINVENKELLLYSIEIDQLLLNQLTNRFFSVFSNVNHQKPDWESIPEICLAESTFIKKSGLDEEVYNLDAFIEPRRQILSDGTLTGFAESEINQKTSIYGNIAQRYSTYEKSGTLNGIPFKATGNKIFQFIKTRKGWKISSVVWEDFNLL